MDIRCFLSSVWVLHFALKAAMVYQDAKILRPTPSLSLQKLTAWKLMEV